MYWSWQSGYINFKIEATNKFGEDFIYHLGGYLPPFLNQKEVGFGANGDMIKVIFDAQGFLKSAAQKAKAKIMSPGQSAVELAEAAVDHFYIEAK